MKTFATVEIAREAATLDKTVVCIIEIEHAEQGQVFILCKGLFGQLERALKAKPMPEVKRLIKEYDLMSPDQIKAERDQHLSNKCKCERCGKHVDGHSAYSQKEWARIGNFKPVQVIAYYCEGCTRLLKGIGAGESSEMDQRASDVPSYEPTNKGDF